MKQLVIGLFKGRHTLPVERFIFDETVSDPTDLDNIDEAVEVALKNADEVVLYVTGLTVATTAVCSYCFKVLVPLTLMHYDNQRKMYFPQVVISEEQISFLRGR